MQRFVGTIIKRARKERGLSQIKLIEKIGEHHISLRTLRRIENSEHVRDYSVNILLDFFKINLQYILLDSNEIEIAKDELSDYTQSINECIYEINCRIAEYRDFSLPNSQLAGRYHITTLFEFLIYLPLIDSHLLFESLRRIDGNISQRFDYVFNNLEFLYNHIPDTKMRDIADELSKRVFMQDYPISETLLAEYEKYENLLSELAGENLYPVD